jgi:hypothetical protein
LTGDFSNAPSGDFSNALDNDTWFSSMGYDEDEPRGISKVGSDIRSRAEVEHFAEGAADIPFLYPVPFKELSSITPYSLDETLWEMSDRLMLLYKRHFLCHRPGKETVSAVTPFVKPRFMGKESVERYIEEKLARFLTVQEAQKALKQIHLSLQEQVQAQQKQLPAAIPASKSAWRKPAKRKVDI